MKWKVVNPLNNELLESITEVIRKAELGLDSIDNYYDELAQGTCGTVYAINEELVLKANDLVYSLKDVNDHIVLESLQGLPFVPTLYAYTPDGKYLIIQRIKGLTLWELELNNNPYQFNYEELKQQLKKFVAGCLERGWIPNDLHAGNVMACPQGVYVVDYGYFRRCNNPARMSSYRRMSMECELDNLEEMLERVSKPSNCNSSHKKTVTVNFLTLSVLPQ
ncbi:hypothetical protein LG52_40 [Geobacillus kaustophilus]|uniref:Uncharacterized protein n=1 Tax=Geobacillus kaustophilus TaxID=1462 RepID=A0A0D8BVC5_GEOKU|nr:hypothetical protein [Geobacillus kaustophilus]KJE27939.1 hypothetical protein LG52_40 [Geobacillus kaustophilus]